MLSSRSMRWFLASVCTSLIAVGCTTTADTPSGETGSLELDLVIADSIVINSVDWTISSPGMDDMTGTIDTSAPGATASVEVFGLPPGDDYTILLEATDETDEVTCKGDADFGVEVGESTNVMVMLRCKRPERLGGVRVNGKFNVCADLAKVIVSPLETSVGYDIDLFAMAVDAELDDIDYVWSGMGGIIDDPNAPVTTYTCATVGVHEITIAVTDDDMEYCVDSWTVPVRCVEGDVDLCEDVDCIDGNQCTDNDCNPANGECINEPLTDGTLCEIVGVGDGVCEAGECVEVDLCEGKDCSDGNECTLDLCNELNGNCSNPPVQDGDECNGGDGMCFEGNCVDIDKCEDVICEPTLNDCTVGICNMDTGECDIVNIPDGEDCNGGAGSCSNGECIDDNLCDEVDCTSLVDCVFDGTCDPANGECIPGNNLPEGAECNLPGIGIGVCDGAGTCVECNEALDCGEAPKCFAPTCVDNACGEEELVDGTECDLVGIGDGVCDAGECVDPPECISPGDCIDGNPCTIGDCTLLGVCVFDPDVGASCDSGSGSGDGTCNDEGSCASNDECGLDADCPDDDGNECTIPVCDTTGAPYVCDEDADAANGNECDGGAGTCQDGTCEVVAALLTCDPTGQGAVTPCLSEFVLADDCFVVTGSVPVPTTPIVTPTEVLFDGVQTTVFPQAQASLPWPLLCTLAGPAMGGADLKDSALEFVRVGSLAPDFTTHSYVNPTSPFLPNVETPHGVVTLDFNAACQAEQDITVNLFGSNIAGVCEGNFLEGGGTCVGGALDGSACTWTTDCYPTSTLDLLDLAGTLGTNQALSVVPTGAVELFGFTHADIAVDLGDVLPPVAPDVCIGGACPIYGTGQLGSPIPAVGTPLIQPFDTCPPTDRDGDGVGGGSDDSPRIMYDANCGTADASDGVCVPFVTGDDAFEVLACDLGTDTTNPNWGQSCTPATSDADCGTGVACTLQTLASLFTSPDPTFTASGFANLSDCCNAAGSGIAAGETPGCSAIPDGDPPRTAACAGILALYPTATQAQWVQVPVNP